MDAGSTKLRLGHHPCVSRVSSMQIYGCGGVEKLGAKAGSTRRQYRGVEKLDTKAGSTRGQYCGQSFQSAGDSNRVTLLLLPTLRRAATKLQNTLAFPNTPSILTLTQKANILKNNIHQFYYQEEILWQKTDTSVSIP